jgi:4-aminobutyrate aminotransferase-like enzyme
MTGLPSGDLLPHIAVSPPGPNSRALATRLRRHESPNVTFISDEFPIFWREALGANVLDVDGNIYVDLTAGFGVATSGHRNPRVSRAIHDQTNTLVHGLGDVHPPDLKVLLLERLAQVTPPGLDQAILASSGAEAVEAALKTARLASGRPGVLCFKGAYHGLTYGALAVTDGRLFREPFEDQLGVPIARVPFPDPFRPPPELEGQSELGRAAVELAAQELDRGCDNIGAVIVEPIQGRSGVVIPPTGFLTGLRELCDRRGLVLIFDEIYTGFGRTGCWFACEHEAVVPDLMCVGKALSGALPFSACIGRENVMTAWPASDGAAIHTSTFLGHPLACAAAIAQIDEIENQDLVGRSARLGAHLLQRIGDWKERYPSVGEVRGRGLLAAVDLVHDPTSKQPAWELARRLSHEALRRGVIVLDDITLSPPLTITGDQLEFAIQTLEDCLSGR